MLQVWYNNLIYQNLNMSEKQKPTINPGKLIFRWNARDRQPHHRGVLWHSVFFGVFLLMIAYGLWGHILLGTSDRDWVMVIMAAFIYTVYYFTHRNGPQIYEIGIYEKGLKVGKQCHPWYKFEGYWFIYFEDQGVSTVQFQLKDKDDALNLQLESLTPDDMRIIMSHTPLTELTDKKEKLLDLWIRALRL